MTQARTASGLAEKVLGQVSDFRKVLELDPDMSGLQFPPEVSKGLEVADSVGDLVGFDVPTESEIKDYALGQIRNALGDLPAEASTFLGQVEGVLGEVVKIGDTAVTVQQTIDDIKQGDFSGVSGALQSIQWLIS